MRKLVLECGIVECFVFGACGFNGSDVKSTQQVLGLITFIQQIATSFYKFYVHKYSFDKGGVGGGDAEGRLERGETALEIQQLESIDSGSLRIKRELAESQRSEKLNFSCF
jgi:hypothetical protein